MQTKVLRANSKLLKLLGHLKRLEIICLLHGHELTVNQIISMTGLRQSAVSQHLMMLKKANLVRSGKLGKEIYYTLKTEVFDELSEFIHAFTLMRPVDNREPHVTDPVCHMNLTPATASYSCVYNGVKHYFCGKGCLTKFKNIYRSSL